MISPASINLTSLHKDISTQIAEQIRIAAPLAVVWPRWVLGHEARDWPALMRSSLDAGRVHGWTVTRRVATSQLEMSGHVTKTELFLISGVHYHDVGTDADNSEDKFQDEIDRLMDQFALNDPSAPDMADHDGLQFRVIGLQNSGAELLHWALADLTIRIC